MTAENKAETPGTETQLFAGFPVSNLDRALDWYAAALGRAADETVGEEAMWQLTEHTWVFVAPDAQRAGGGLMTLGVASLDRYLERWRDAGLTHEPVETYGNGVRHVTIIDPDGNSLSLAEAPAAP